MLLVTKTKNKNKNNRKIVVCDRRTNELFSAFNFTNFPSGLLFIDEMPKKKRLIVKIVILL